MKTSNRVYIAVGAGILGLGTALGSVSPVAAPRNDVRAERRDVKEARKDVKQERKDVRKADNPGERREERHELNDARQDLRHEQRELEQARRENRPAPGWHNQPVHGAPAYRAPAYNAPYYNAPRPAWNSRQVNTQVNFNGTVLDNSPASYGFRVRSDQGTIYTVSYPYESFRRGQRINVVGYSQNGVIIANDIDYI